MSKGNKDTLTQSFYNDLPQRYLTEVRRFVPSYDTLVEIILDQASTTNPKEILDLGSGIGNIEEILLNKLPHSQITAVELSPEMSTATMERIKDFQNRVTIRNIDICKFVPDKKFDFIFSNLVIHNVPFLKKDSLISSIKDWLKPSGVFLWSDLVVDEDASVTKHLINKRREYAIRHGAEINFADKNFEKEIMHDAMLTIRESVEMLHRGGFQKVENIFLKDMSAVFRAKA